ncbi:MAG: peptide-methionine (R)-S-oxide reductase MsrB [bacterium]
MKDTSFSTDHLSPEEMDITQNAGTEAPFTGKYWNEHADGTYTCKVCSQVLFDSEHKFESGSGWPSFDRAVPDSIVMKTDSSHGMARTEVICSKCGAHLGHMFEDGPKDTTGQRFCINSASLDLKKKSS